MKGVGRIKSPYTDSLAHTTWECKYHIVFAPKFRRKEIKRELINYINYYNNERIKLRLKGKSPIQYRMDFEQVA